ncbi:MAG: hypothetical protein L0Y71_14715 [Gemmataceae bacterium]|nr:hypothetical protein [Gemmataceae bacterium]
MHMLTPDLVADLCGLSLGVVLAGGVIGLVLWLFGWKSHRFWVVLLTTVSAGVYGLHEAATLKTPPLVAGVLLAVAAGVLALALVRLLAFWAGGVAGLLIVQAAAPSLDQPLVVFIVSGLVSLLLFRWFLMVLTSFAGSVLVCCAGVALLNMYGALDAVAWAEQGTTLLNWICGLMAALGFLWQFVLERRGSRRQIEEADDEDDGMLVRFSRLYRRAG